jgi:Kef-type K+ transport system membrane component KefB
MDRVLPPVRLSNVGRVTASDHRPQSPGPALVADCVGVGVLFALAAFGQLWSHHLNVVLNVWLALNAFAVGSMLVAGAWWTAWRASQVAGKSSGTT